MIDVAYYIVHNYLFVFRRFICWCFRYDVRLLWIYITTHALIRHMWISCMPMRMYAFFLSILYFSFCVFFFINSNELFGNKSQEHMVLASRIHITTIQYYLYMSICMYNIIFGYYHSYVIFHWYDFEFCFPYLSFSFFCVTQHLVAYCFQHFFAGSIKYFNMHVHALHSLFQLRIRERKKIPVVKNEMTRNGCFTIHTKIIHFIRI